GSIDLTGLTDLTGLAVSDRAEERVRGAASVSVIVPTIDGPSAAVRCVKALLDTGYPDLEVVVVDNRPDPANAVQWQALTSSDPRIRLVSESRPGVSYARNAGVAAARGELVAFVDDDIEVDHGWLDTLTAELGDGTVDCATSLVLPATLDTEAQRLFERMKGFGQGFQRRVFAPQLAEHDPGYVFTPGRFGPGGCALWRRSAFLRLGGFDTRLGGGTPALAGEDLHLFLRLARSGGTVVYSPDAIAWHHHSVSWPQVRGRIRGYGTGLSAVYLLHLVQRPDDLTRLARILPGRAWQVVFGAAARRGAETVERADARHRIPRRLVADQLIGVCQGPLALIRSARRAHRLST
ncbi:MAG: glycosyltransferase family 2 protein, partial [Sciscionella sp.]